MSFYLTDTDCVLRNYATRALKQSKQTLRPLSDDDLRILAELRTEKKNTGICITEIIFIKKVVLCINSSELHWITNNLERISKSLCKQRDLIKAVSKSIMICEPNNNERKTITKFIADLRKRVDYLRTVPLSENIKLTPIQDYIDLVGKEKYIDELKTEFPDAKAMIEGTANLDAYIKKIMLILEKADKHELYKERLNKYIEAEKARKEKQRGELEAEKKAYAKNEAQNGILFFVEQFYKGIKTLKGSGKIGLTEKAIHYQLSKGNRGKFIVLCCGYSRGRITYKYMLESGKDSPSFMNAYTFNTINDANIYIRKIQENYPERVFQAVVI